MTPPSTTASKPKVFVLSSGLGRISRGYESFSQECFDALRHTSEYEIHLLKGRGPRGDRERAIPSLCRKSKVAALFGHIMRRDPYWIEQFTFALGLLPEIIRTKPEILYFSDGSLGNMLWHFRRFFGFGYRLLFSNGGPLSPPFTRWELIQQLAPVHLQNASESGQSDESQCLVPYGFLPPRCDVPPSRQDILRIRSVLKLPENRRIVLAVGAVNCTHKRMDYVIEELAAIQENRPYLVLLGQRDNESNAVESLATSRLGRSDFTIRTAPANEVQDYLLASDIFVLSSVSEGFPRVVGEAAMSFLPCIVHDYPLMRYILGSHGHFCDATQNGQLLKTLRALLNEYPATSVRIDAARCARERFSWGSLTVRYLAMFERCLQLGIK